MKKISDHKKVYAVNFDFSMDKLKEHYPNSNITQAYDDVKRFLTSQRFEHRQGSGYMSTVTMTEAKFNEIIYRMFDKYSWMPKSLKTADVTIVEAEFDLLEKYRKQKDKQMNEITPIQEIEAKDNTDELFTLLQDVVSKGLEMKNQTQQKVREIEDEIEI